MAQTYETARTAPVGRLMTIAETAALLAVSRATIYLLIDEGFLPTVRVRSHIRIAESDVGALIARRRAEAALR